MTFDYLYLYIEESTLEGIKERIFISRSEFYLLQL